MFITPAWAQDAATSAGDAAAPGGLMSFLGPIAPILLVFFIFYIVVIRPQSKRMSQHRKSIDELQKGDKVVTGGGIVATVKRLTGDNEIELEIAQGVVVTVLRDTIMSIRESRAMTAAAVAASSETKK